MTKFVYFFSAGRVDGNKDLKELLGGKGANLAEMCGLGLSVPPGLTISTEACKKFYEKEQVIWPQLKEEIISELKEVERLTGKTFGKAQETPLLVSIRSGASISMPGMMDTILNLGLNDETVKVLIKETNNPAFVWDSYRRFIQMYAEIVMEINAHFFEILLDDLKTLRDVEKDSDLSAEDLEGLTVAYKRVVLEEKGMTFPQDVYEQLWLAIGTVFKSWNNDRAIQYRNFHNLPQDLGTAVNVQAMVFGNYGESSGTGVLFSRNPSTGENKLFGEFLVNAQGEDVVAGIRTPSPINEASKRSCE